MRVTSLFKKLFFILAFLITSVSAHAVCEKRDIWPELFQQNPDAKKSLERDIEAMPFGQGVLFRISKEGVKPSYVLGTIHTYDPRYIPLHPSVVDAFDKTKRTVLELGSLEQADPMVIMGNDPANFVLNIVAQSGERPLDFLSKEEQEQVSQIAERLSLPASPLLTLKPSMLAMLLSMAGCETTDYEKKVQGVEYELERLSRLNKKSISGLETLLEQLKSINGVSLEIQKSFLRSVLVGINQADEMEETLTLMYLRGETAKLVMLMRTPLELRGKVFDPLPQVMLEKILDDRNLRMQKRAMPYLKMGESFIAVGAAHLPGEKGLLNLIQDQGYTIERIH